MEVIQNKYKENKQQRHLSHHEPVSLGVCKKVDNDDDSGSAWGRDQIYKQKVIRSNNVNTGN